MKFLLFFYTLTFTLTAEADVYFVDSISSTQSESSLLRELKQSIKDSFSKADQNLTEEPLDADWVIEPTLILSKNLYTLSLSKRNSKSKIFKDSLKAKTKKELFKAAEELVARTLLFNNNSLSKSAYEEQNKHLMYHFGEDTKSRFFAGLGYGGGDGIDEADNQGFSLSLGYLRMLNRYIGARGGADALFLNASDGATGNINVGFEFYPMKRKHSPYLSTLVGYSWTKSGVLYEEDGCEVLCEQVEQANKSGLGASVGLGYHFYRNLPMHFGVELFYNLAFYEIQDQAPESFGGRLVFYWK